MPFVPQPGRRFAQQFNTFPASPTENMVVQIPGVGIFTYVGSRWTSGSDVVLTAGIGVVACKAVTAVGGDAVLTNRATHLQVTGVVRAIVGALAVVRRDGIVGGFVGLSDGNRLFVGADPGSIVAGPLVPSVRIMPIGWAMPAGEIMVHLYEPKGT